tara:strand:- start:397 stop:684 length:288 start_codon:yes stop_codon:yes gene_type:complete
MTEDIVSLCTKGNWHFYLKDNNYQYVYLSFFLGHNDVPAGRNITFESPVELRIPIDIWREMVFSWSDTKWAKNLNLDNMTREGQNFMKVFDQGKK